MSSEETASKTKAPDLYYFTSTDSVWHLEKSNISTQKIFSCNPFTSWSKIIQFIAGLFTFGFLISNCCIQKPQSDQILPWNRKIISEHCKLQKRIPHPQLVLSPQQLRILEENKRRIYIVGEPGTGKTMLLLAKMFEAAKDPNVDHVLFFYPDAKSEFNMANIAARMGLLANVDWIISMIGKEGGDFFGQHSGKIIFYACNNGSYKAIEWGVRTVEKYGSLQKELEATYNTWDGQKTTLLLFLCHMNIDDMQPIKLLREKGFPANLLLIKYEMRNVLEKSLFYKNHPMAEELLKDNLWARTLIPSKKELIKLIKQVKNNANQSPEPVNTDLLKLLNTRFEATRICRY